MCKDTTEPSEFSKALYEGLTAKPWDVEPSFLDPTPDGTVIAISNKRPNGCVLVEIEELLDDPGLGEIYKPRRTYIISKPGIFELGDPVEIDFRNMRREFLD